MKTYLILAILTILTSAGCSADINYPSPANLYYSNYRTNTTCQTRLPTLLILENGQDYKIYPFGVFNRLPSTPEDYKANPSLWPQILSVLPAKTTIHITSIGITKNFETGDIMHVYGKLTLNDKIIEHCKLDFISSSDRTYKGILILTVNTNILEQVKQPQVK